MCKHLGPVQVRHPKYPLLLCVCIHALRIVSLDKILHPINSFLLLIKKLIIQYIHVCLQLKCCASTSSSTNASSYVYISFILVVYLCECVQWFKFSSISVHMLKTSGFKTSLCIRSKHIKSSKECCLLGQNTILYAN